MNLQLVGQIQQMSDWYISYFSQKTGFDISWKLSPKGQLWQKATDL